MFDEITAEYSKCTLKDFEAANICVEPKNMPGHFKVHHETDVGEDKKEFEFERLKFMLMKAISFNAKL